MIGSVWTDIKAAVPPFPGVETIQSWLFPYYGVENPPAAAAPLGPWTTGGTVDVSMIGQPSIGQSIQNWQQFYAEQDVRNQQFTQSQDKLWLWVAGAVVIGIIILKR